MKLKHIALLFATTGTLLLYLLSTLTQPTIIALDQISNFEGKQITTEGVVSDYYSTKYGSQMITIKNNNTSAIVFLEDALEIEFGDIIQVTGPVQKYNDDFEIIVENIRDLKIICKWNNISFPVWQLAENPTRYEGLNVNISGIVDSVFDTYFHLKDTIKNNALLVFYYSNSFIYPGKEVSVSGKFLFDEETLRYKLIISEENHGVFLKAGE